MSKTVEHDSPFSWAGENWMGCYKVEIDAVQVWDQIRMYWIPRGDMILVICRGKNSRWWDAVWRGTSVEIHESDLKRL